MKTYGVGWVGNNVGAVAKLAVILVSLVAGYRSQVD